MSATVSNGFGDWRHLVEKPLSAEDVERAVEPGSIPAVPFLFLLTCSAGIATFVLLSNSAAVIIGATIVAPLIGQP